MRARSAPFAPTLLTALTLLMAAGCSAYRPFDSAGYLRGEYSRLLGPEAGAGIEVPFALSPELAESFHRQVRPAAGPRARVTQVVDFVFERLDLKYSLAPTRSASATFQSRQGNCLSFVNLFVGLTRDLGLAPFYVEVTDYQRWNHRQGMVVSQGHIVAGLYLDGELSTYDFLPYRTKAYRNFKPIDDLTAAAHYFNNLGAEALLGGTCRRPAASPGSRPGSRPASSRRSTTWGSSRRAAATPRRRSRPTPGRSRPSRATPPC